MRVEVEFDWEDVGEVRLSPSGKLAFPRLPIDPGIYRFRVSQVSGAEVYIGESENLRQRMEHNYRYHLGTTNVRVRKVLLEHVAAGRRIEFSIARNASFKIDGKQATADLSAKQVRLLMENAALVAARISGDRIHNL